MDITLVAPSIITGVLGLLGIWVSAKSSQRVKSLETAEQGRSNDLQGVRAASEEWRVLYTTLRTDVEEVKTQLHNTRKRVEALEQVNTNLRTLLARITAFLEWVRSDECYTSRTDTPPDNIAELLEKSKELLG